MLILRGLACLSLMLPAWALGALWVRHAWRRGDAFTHFTLGAVAGGSAHLVALNALSYLWLPKQATLLLVLVELAACAAWKVLAKTPPAVSGKEDAAAVRALAPWLLPVALAWMWFDLRSGGGDQLFHASVTMPLARSGLPAFHPFDTGQTFVYHYGLDLMAAGYGSLAGLKPWWALNVLLAALTPLLLASCVEFLRAAGAREGRAASRAELWGATLLFALGGNFTWMEALWNSGSLARVARPDVACDGLGLFFAAPAILSGWTWTLAVLAMALRWPQSSPEESAPQRGAPSPVLPFGLTLAALPLLAEQGALAVGAALIVFTLWQAWKRRGRFVKELLAAGALGLGVALVQGGVLTGLLLNLSASSGLRPGWTGSWWPSFPTLEKREWFPSAQERLHYRDVGYWRVVWREYAHTLAALPVLLVWIFRRAPAAVRWLVGASLPGVLIALYAAFPINDFETFRFYQFYFGAAMLATGLWLGRVWDRSAAPGGGEAGRLPRWRRKGTRALVLVLFSVLAFQGARLTLLRASANDPRLPFDYPAGQRAALEAMEARGGLQEGVLERAYVPGLRWDIPAAPGVLGRAVRASTPGCANATVTRSPAWRRAYHGCPSPFNLRAARARWICLQGAALSRALPVLEGAGGYAFQGAFGKAPRFRLYRYGGPWSGSGRGYDELRALRRHPLFGASLARRRLKKEVLAVLSDGDPGTSVRLPAALLAQDGLVLVPVPETRTRPQLVSMLWVLAQAGSWDFGVRGGLRVEYQRKKAAPGARTGTWNWTPLLPQEQHPLFDPARPHAWGVRFAPRRTVALRVRLNRTPPNASRKTVTWCEVYVGTARTFGPARGRRGGGRQP